MLTNRLELTAIKLTEGELSGAYRVTAWRGMEYLGNETFLYYTKREALRVAREIVLSSGGLGIYSRS